MTTNDIRRILVTGASGNVGREVVRVCLASGLHVRRGVRDPADTTGLAETTPFSFEDPRTWTEATAQCDGVFLLRPPALADMAATLNPFVDTAYRNGVQHIIFLSVSGPERMSWVPHNKVERHLATTNHSWTILRAGFFAQNLQDAYRADIVHDDRLYVPAGDGRVAFLDVADVGAVCARIFDAPKAFARRAYTLTGPAALTFAEVAQVLMRVLHRSIRYEPASIAGYMRHLTRRRGQPLVQAAIQTYLHVGLRRGEAEAVTRDVSELLGKPASALEAYVERCAATWSR